MDGEVVKKRYFADGAPDHAWPLFVEAATASRVINTVPRQTEGER